MAEFSPKERFLKALCGPIFFGIWLYFFDALFPHFLSTPLGQLTFAEILGPICYFLLFIPKLIYGTISWTYEAWTGRDSVWLWHPD